MFHTDSSMSEKAACEGDVKTGHYFLLGNCDFIVQGFERTH